MTKSVFPDGLFGDSLKAISHYLFKKLKLYLHQLNSKNNGTVLLSKTISRHLNCFLLSVAMDDRDGLGLKLEKLRLTFSRFNAVPAKITPKKFCGQCRLVKFD